MGFLYFPLSFIFISFISLWSKWLTHIVSVYWLSDFDLRGLGSGALALHANGGIVFSNLFCW